MILGAWGSFRRANNLLGGSVSLGGLGVGGNYVFVNKIFVVDRFVF